MGIIVLCKSFTYKVYIAYANGKKCYVDLINICIH